ncbi:MAG: hypothetical protein AMXMBFR61_21120 [Fimbriimonadales bacterium]
MFRITSDVIAEDAPRDPAAGAYVVFEGRVRDTNEGRRVLAVEYEAHEELAVTEGESVLSEARERYGLQDARCVHRVGRLNVGDTAVWVCAVSGHRSQAFAACRYIIDEVKRRVPIWKKEHYAEGGSEWLRGAPLGAGAVSEEAYYSRQTLLPQLAGGGQQRLRDARVLVVGAGGLGCAALPYLVAAGVGQVSVCDSDPVDVSNLHRQVLFSANDIGRRKAEVAAERLRSLNPFVSVAAYPYRLAAENVEALVSDHDVVLDCTDNFETKFLLNDACVALGTPLVQASIYQMEGQIQLIAPGSGCLRCQWPETPPSGCVGSCAEVGVLGVLPGLFGVLQATETIKLITGIGECLTRTLLLVDLRTYQVTRLERPPNPSCPACGPRSSAARYPASRAAESSRGAVGISLATPSPWSEAEGGGLGRGSDSPEPTPHTPQHTSLLTPPSHSSPSAVVRDERAEEPSPTWMVRADCPELGSMVVIDLRELDEEREPVPLVDAHALHIPMSRFSRELPGLDPAKHYVLVCAHGNRASRLARHLHSQGLTNFLALDPRAYSRSG